MGQKGAQKEQQGRQQACQRDTDQPQPGEPAQGVQQGKEDKQGGGRGPVDGGEEHPGAGALQCRNTRKRAKDANARAGGHPAPGAQGGEKDRVGSGFPIRPGPVSEQGEQAACQQVERRRQQIDLYHGDGGGNRVCLPEIEKRKEKVQHRTQNMAQDKGAQAAGDGTSRRHQRSPH